MITQALKRITLSVLHGGLLLATLVMSGSAYAATTVFSTHVQGQQAQGDWQISTSCGFTDVQVTAGESSNVSNNSNGPVKGVFVNVSGFVLDVCSEPISYVNFYGSATDTSVQFAGKKLSSATLQVTMPVFEYGSNGDATGMLTLNLSWANNGTYTTNGVSNVRTFAGGGLLIDNRFVGGSSIANATGTFILDGSDLGLSSSASAYLIYSNNGSVTLQKF